MIFSILIFYCSLKTLIEHCLNLIAQTGINFLKKFKYVQSREVGLQHKPLNEAQYFVCRSINEFCSRY